MKIDFSQVVKSAGLDEKVFNSLNPQNNNFSKYFSEFESKKVKKVNEAQKQELNDLKNIMECQMKVHDLSMKVELVSRVAEAGVSSIRKLQNGI